VADRGNWLLRVGEVPHEGDHAGIQPQVLGRTSAGDNEAVEPFGVDLVERCIQAEVVPAFLAIGLLSLEVVNRRGDRVPRPLARADRMYVVPDHLEHLERDHDFVVLDVVSGEEEDFLCGHSRFP
jgi:hypothetical protein